MDWVRENWHVLLGVILAFGVLGLAAALICSPCWLSLVGLAALSEFVAETPYAFLSPTPTSVPTSTPISLPVGQTLTWEDGMRIGVTEYSVSHTCPGGYGEPAEGAKFLVIHVHAENANQEVVLRIPSLTFTLLRRGSELAEEAGWSVCSPDGNSWGDVGRRYDWELYPGVSCQGWVLFQVPEGLNPEETVVQVLARDVTGWEDWRLEAQWRLGP